MPKYLPKRNEKLCPHKDLYIKFIAALFTMAQRWKQPKCPSLTDEWINKMWSNQTMGYYSTIKRNEVLTCAII